MPDESLSSGARWVATVELDRVQPSKPIAVRVEGRQVALFRRDGEVLACNNRCPHEGYPLSEGVLDDECVLTCNWHNWKFDLRTGETLYGGDRLRVYPAMVRDGVVHVDVSEAPVAERIDAALVQLDGAIADMDSARIARELARLDKLGASPDVALRRAIASTHERLPDGMTHAYAAADAWFRLRDTLGDDASRLACAAEAIGYIAFDTLRESRHDYATATAPWDAAAFAAAVEAQDEAQAIALVHGALAAGRSFDDLRRTLTDVALAHYNDFGHSLIYLEHARRLVGRLGTEVAAPLLRSWVRSVVLATREDLLPDFARYADALAAAGAAVAGGGACRRVDPSALVEALDGASVRRALDIVVDNATADPLDLHAALMETASRHLLRFDESRALRTDNSVADNVGWLDFSHALTFGHAVRRVCTRRPSLWTRGLLQMAMFCGRNVSYLDPALASPAVLREWAVDDEDVFHAWATSRIVDHGIGLPIFPAHWLKTWSAVRETIDDGVPASTRAAMLAATRRLLSVQFKQRHVLRMATQALRFVEKED